MRPNLGELHAFTSELFFNIFRSTENQLQVTRIAVLHFDRDRNAGCLWDANRMIAVAQSATR
jgi:hypothetical protein